MADEIIIDLTRETQIATDKDQPCPICGTILSVDDLVAHCDAHFAAAETDAAAPLSISTATAAAAAAGALPCPLCGEILTPDELESHALVHALECEDVDAIEKAMMASAPSFAENEIHFEQLRAQYGFGGPQRPGLCFLCKQPGHWSPECPQNPINITAKARVIENVTAGAAAAAQQPEPQFLKPSMDPEGLIRKLAACCVQQKVASEYSRCTTLLSGPVLHCGGQKSDAGWGCGYRNIQMQISHLMARQPAAGIGSTLFVGAQFIPDVPSLQAWIEVAWKAGFDAVGAEQLEHSLQGGKKWIGSTEAATVLRYFGVPAQIIDFSSKKIAQQQQQPAAAAAAVSDAKGSPVPKKQRTIDSFLSPLGPSTAPAPPPAPIPPAVGEKIEKKRLAIHRGCECDGCSMYPIIGVRYKSLVLPNYDLCAVCHDAHRTAAGPFEKINSPPSMQAQQQGGDGASGSSSGAQKGCSPAGKALLEWVWSYFNTPDESSSSTSGLLPPPPALLFAGSSLHRRDGNTTPKTFSRIGPSCKLDCRLTGLSPLYLQHEGHSRTIIGIEKKEWRHGAPELTLLMFDPGCPPPALRDAVQKGVNWQRLVKRSAHTLKQTQFQIVYCPEGAVPVLPGSVEYEQLKVLAAQDL